jgi:hypothetical protein
VNNENWIDGFIKSVKRDPLRIERDPENKIIYEKALKVKELRDKLDNTSLKMHRKLTLQQELIQNLDSLSNSYIQWLIKCTQALSEEAITNPQNCLNILKQYYYEKDNE